MKLNVEAVVQLYIVDGTKTRHIEVLPGEYSIEVRIDPSGKSEKDWYVFTNPKEIGPEFEGKIIGTEKLWVMNQSYLQVE